MLITNYNSINNYIIISILYFGAVCNYVGTFSRDKELSTPENLFKSELRTSEVS